METIEKIKLYISSVGKYGDSPFIYPMWGLSGIAEGFSRLSAINGGTFMLNSKVEEILFDDKGVFRGIKSNGQVFKIKLILLGFKW